MIKCIEQQDISLLQVKVIKFFNANETVRVTEDNARRINIYVMWVGAFFFIVLVDAMLILTPVYQINIEIAYLCIHWRD